MLKIEVFRRPSKFVDKLPLKHARQIIGKIQSLAENPTPHDSIQLAGKASAYRRADIGEYRIIYRVEKNMLMVEAIGRRNDGQVYRDFERKL